MASALLEPSATDKTLKQKPEVPVVPIEKRLALTLPECAALSNLKVCRLRAAIWGGELAFIRSGERGRYIVRREALEKFLQAQEEREAR